LQLGDRQDISSSKCAESLAPYTSLNGPKTTMIYTYVSRSATSGIESPLDRL